MEKNFDHWNGKKKKLDNISDAIKRPLFNEREIWYCSIGVNIGKEMYGKGENHARPVLIIRKFDNHTFLGVPLTTTLRESQYYVALKCDNKDGMVALRELKTYDARRLCEKIEQIGKNKFDAIKQAICDIIINKSLHE